MRKKIIALLIVTTMALSLTACEDSIVEDSETETESTEMFERHTLDDRYSILVDKETGVCYLEYGHTSGYQGYYGITVMLNADGTPKIWREN